MANAPTYVPQGTFFNPATHRYPYPYAPYGAAMMPGVMPVGMYPYGQQYQPGYAYPTAGMGSPYNMSAMMYAAPSPQGSVSSAPSVGAPPGLSASLSTLPSAQGASMHTQVHGATGASVAAATSASHAESSPTAAVHRPSSGLDVAVDVGAVGSTKGGLGSSQAMPIDVEAESASDVVEPAARPRPTAAIGSSSSSIPVSSTTPGSAAAYAAPTSSQSAYYQSYGMQVAYAQQHQQQQSSYGQQQQSSYGYPASSPAFSPFGRPYGYPMTSMPQKYGSYSTVPAYPASSTVPAASYPYSASKYTGMVTTAAPNGHRASHQNSATASKSKNGNGSHRTSVPKAAHSSSHDSAARKRKEPTPADRARYAVPAYRPVEAQPQPTSLEEFAAKFDASARQKSHKAAKNRPTTAAGPHKSQQRHGQHEYGLIDLTEADRDREVDPSGAAATQQPLEVSVWCSLMHTQLPSEVFVGWLLYVVIHSLSQTRQTISHA